MHLQRTLDIRTEQSKHHVIHQIHVIQELMFGTEWQQEYRLTTEKILLLICSPNRLGLV
jgi:hypothetical protein